MQTYGVSELSLFGSRARGDEHEGSDLDVLAAFSATPSLLTWITVENELTDLLGVRVDLVLQHSLKPHIRERISNDLIPV